MHARAILGLPVDVTLASPGASAVIYGGLDEPAIAFENVAAALAIPETDIRLFGKPESFLRRRMGVVIATADDVGTARQRAGAAARLVRPISTSPQAETSAVPARRKEREPKPAAEPDDPAQTRITGRPPQARPPSQSPLARRPDVRLQKPVGTGDDHR